MPPWTSGEALWCLWGCFMLLGSVIRVVLGLQSDRAAYDLALHGVRCAERSASGVCYACWLMDYRFVGQVVGSIGSVVAIAVLICIVVRYFLIWGRRFRSSIISRCLFVCLFLRVGEASHPGPARVPSTWSLGIFNPSGLRSKIDALAFLPGDIWLGSETHLTQDGFRAVKRGLRSLQSPYRYAVSGAFCPIRTSGGAGMHQGVISISKFPARNLPHAIPDDLCKTAGSKW